MGSILAAHSAGIKFASTATAERKAAAPKRVNLRFNCRHSGPRPRKPRLSLAFYVLARIPPGASGLRTRRRPILARVKIGCHPSPSFHHSHSQVVCQSEPYTRVRQSPPSQRSIRRIILLTIQPALRQVKGRDIVLTIGSRTLMPGAAFCCLDIHETQDELLRKNV